MSGKTSAQLDAEIGAELAKPKKPSAAALKKAVRRHIKAGQTPYRAVKLAMRELGLVLSVQGDEGDNRLEVWDVVGDRGRPELAIEDGVVL